MGWGEMNFFFSLQEVQCALIFTHPPSLHPSDIMNNKVFYQHPNLMRVLGMHETVMEVMVNVLGGDKSQVRRLQTVELVLEPDCCRFPVVELLFL